MKPAENFLNSYFSRVYNKLYADFDDNRTLPHAGIKGTENENTLAAILVDFLPPKYGVEPNALVIDHEGKVSRQCDIVVYDREMCPKYFSKGIPIETVYAIVEVKTQLTKQEAASSLENEVALRKLSFYPQLTPSWQTRTKSEDIRHEPPVHCTFAYRAATNNFSTFMSWFSFVPGLTETTIDKCSFTQWSNPCIICSLDKGVMFTRNHPIRWVAIAEKTNARNFEVIVDGHELEVDPAKALFSFLEILWTSIQQSPRHPGFDIRSYLDRHLNTFVSVDYDGHIVT
jgi:Domain of unknown function (DUF6602)